MSIGVSIVVKCGSHNKSTAAKGFIESKEALAALVNDIDVEKESSTTFEADRPIALSQKETNFDEMTEKLRGVLRAAEATSGDSILHCAACGDQKSIKKVLERPKEYIHKVAIAGYHQLLTSIIQRRRDLIDFMDSNTGRTPLINAALGGSYNCFKYLVDNGAHLDSKDNVGKTALNHAQQLRTCFDEKYLKICQNKTCPVSFYIKHEAKNRFVGISNEYDPRYISLMLHYFNPKTSTLKGNPFLFRFVDDQLQHALSGKYAYPMHGRKGPGVGIGLSDDSDGERTSCFPFDFDPTSCLLAGGDNYFVKVNDNHELEWHKFWDTKDKNNPFDSKNGFEFKIICANVS